MKFRIEIRDTDSNEYGTAVYFDLFIVYPNALVSVNTSESLMLSPQEFEDFAEALKAEVADFSEDQE